MDKILPYLKAYASLIGAVVTALLGVYTTDTPVGQVLTVVAVIATAIATWRVPNITEDPTDSIHGGVGVSGNSDDPVFDPTL